MAPPAIEYEKLTPGYEFAPASFQMDSERVTAYLGAVGDQSSLYKEKNITPPMAMAALAMAALATGLTLPPATIHVSQSLEFKELVSIGEKLTSYARVNRKMERGKFHLLTIGINVLNQHKATVLCGETTFILPLTEATP